jgi:uncharacterized repeat protein (TIGR03803 family)
MTKLGGWKSICAVLVLCTATAISSHAQFTSLVSFCLQSRCTDGESPRVGLVQGRDGLFYGTTHDGGTIGYGTVFKITAKGTLTTLHSFCTSSCTDGGLPNRLVLGTDGNFYGTTGGSPFVGTVFKITPGGTLTTLYTFCSKPSCADGEYPKAGLVQGTNGSFYGTTSSGGAYNNGTVFKITPGGTLTTLYNFCSQIKNNICTDGAIPQTELVQGKDGNFYGTTAAYAGEVFKITPQGKLTTLYTFCSQANCVDGADPTGLVQGGDGNFYGTTYQDGANGEGGTVFKMTSTGALTKLYSFCAQSGCTDGAGPLAGLVQGTDGSLYGTTAGGGASGYGAAFKIKPIGGLTTLYSFCSQPSCVDGYSPWAGLLQATNGTFYGTTLDGGTNTFCPSSAACGTVFSLATGLNPFVVIRATSGKEGAKIGILGQGFSDSSVVKFGGVQASTIAVTGSTYILATVPAGALTGPVTVTTGGTTLTSSQTFKVLPTIASFSPTSGPVGTSVSINGTGLTQTTKVAFNGKSASFTVNSDILITASVPAVATTGKIAVTTKGGSATSATSFTVN